MKMTKTTTANRATAAANPPPRLAGSNAKRDMFAAVMKRFHTNKQ